ncbi:hypothetical protein CFSAN000658_16230 [Salmonella enterica subsp. enterica serovar Abaetetuba str. ATCC 35640]|nr:hypothetical protein CFSAN000658_16230 [Salmonella enterica subsp. enterica serovar Abaetetuba str. ATCC 35640]
MLVQSRCNDREVMKEHAASVTQEACDYRGVHAEGLSGQQHQTRENDSLNAVSDVPSEQAAELHHAGACAFQQLTE